MAQGSPLVQALSRELVKFPTLDPRAVFAIAQHEGLSGGIGDNGTSFGPFQLHYGGAYPSFAPQGEQASQAWSWSPAGLDYALGQIAHVAGGLKGAQAIYNISSRFERPANVPAEVADAEAHYGAPLPASGAPAPVAANVSPVPPGASPAPARAAVAPLPAALTRQPGAPVPSAAPNLIRLALQLLA